MLFGKLPVLMLSTILAESDGSTNCHIATSILRNLEAAQAAGIRELAALCSVSTSSISRFCKEIGLEDFSELKEILTDPNLRYEMVSGRQTAAGRAEDYRSHMEACLRQVAHTLDYQAVARLADDLKRYDHIGVFGLMKGATAAISLQSDLLMLGKQAVTKVPVVEQMKYFQQCGKKDLVILFSYTGIYFEYFSGRIPQGLREAKVYFITGNKGGGADARVDEVVAFASDLSPASHPYQLQYAAHIIAQEYAHSR